MDPEDVLRELRAQVAAVLDLEQATGGAEPAHGLVVLAERFRALDEWITIGGVLPRQWRP